MKDRADINFKSPSLFYTYKEKRTLSLLKTVIIICTLIVVCISAFRASFYVTTVDGQSMYPTINKQGTATINAPANKLDKAYYILTNNIHRQDIVIALNGSTPVIKRVIALSGDTVEIFFENDIYGIKVNNEVIDEPYIYNNEQMQISYENFLALKSYNSTKHLADFSACFEGNVLTVPENNIFYLGDNRGNSRDCSYYGPNSIENILAKVEFVVPYGKTVISYFWQQFCQRLGL